MRLIVDMSSPIARSKTQGRAYSLLIEWMDAGKEAARRVLYSSSDEGGFR